MDTGDPHPDPPIGLGEHQSTPPPKVPGSIRARAWRRFARNAKAQRKREDRDPAHRSPLELWLTERDLWWVAALGCLVSALCMLALIVLVAWKLITALHGQMEPPYGAPR